LKEKLQEFEFSDGGALKKDYKKSLELLASMTQSVPEMVSKLERASLALDTLKASAYSDLVQAEQENEESLETPHKNRLSHQSNLEKEMFLMQVLKTPKKSSHVTPKKARSGLLSQLE
jgi:hypothetical protein